LNEKQEKIYNYMTMSERKKEIRKA